MRSSSVKEMLVLCTWGQLILSCLPFPRDGAIPAGPKSGELILRAAPGLGEEKLWWGSGISPMWIKPAQRQGDGTAPCGCLGLGEESLQSIAARPSWPLLQPCSCDGARGAKTDLSCPWVCSCTWACTLCSLRWFSLG